MARRSLSTRVEQFADYVGDMLDAASDAFDRAFVARQVRRITQTEQAPSKGDEDDLYQTFHDMRPAQKVTFVRDVFEKAERSTRPDRFIDRILTPCLGRYFESAEESLVTAFVQAIENSQKVSQSLAGRSAFVEVLEKPVKQALEQFRDSQLHRAGQGNPEQNIRVLDALSDVGGAERTNLARWNRARAQWHVVKAATSLAVPAEALQVAAGDPSYFDVDALVDHAAAVVIETSSDYVVRQRRGVVAGQASDNALIASLQILRDHLPSTFGRAWVATPWSSERLLTSVQHHLSRRPTRDITRAAVGALVTVSKLGFTNNHTVSVLKEAVTQTQWPDVAREADGAIRRLAEPWRSDDAEDTTRSDRLAAMLYAEHAPTLGDANGQGGSFSVNL